MLTVLKRWFSPRPPGAIELKRGSVYVIECSEELCRETFEEITTHLDMFTEKTGCEFLVLDKGFRIAVNARKTA